MFEIEHCMGHECIKYVYLMCGFGDGVVVLRISCVVDWFMLLMQ